MVDRTGAAAGSTIMFGVNNLISVDWQGSTIGDGNPIKWRVVAKDSTTLTLLADNGLGSRRYDTAGSHQLWSGSDICNYLNGTDSTVSGSTSKYAASGGFLQSSFSAAEHSVMVAQYSTVEEQGYNSSDKYTANQTMVFPSFAEMQMKVPGNLQMI